MKTYGEDSRYCKILEAVVNKKDLILAMALIFVTPISGASPDKPMPPSFYEVIPGLIASLTAERFPSNTIYGSNMSGNYVVKSLDGGLTWNNLEINSPNITYLNGNRPGIGAVVVDGLPGGKLFAEVWASKYGFLDQAGIYLSGDGGATWNLTSLPRMPSCQIWRYTPIAIDSVRSSDLYIAMEKVGSTTGYCEPLPDGAAVYRSTNGGVSWELFSKDSSNSIIGPLHAINGAVFHGGYVTRDNGATWQGFSTPIRTYTGSVSDAKVAIGTVSGSGMIIRTIDAGRTWTSVTVSSGNQIMAVAENKFKKGMFFAISQDNSIYYTKNNGATWKFFVSLPLPQSGFTSSMTVGDGGRSLLVPGLLSLNRVQYALHSVDISRVK